MDDIYQNRGFWLGLGALIVVAALGLWWITASRPIGLDGLNGLGNASSTSQDIQNSTDSGPVTVTNLATDVLSVLGGIAGTSRFASLLSTTGVSGMVTGKGPYTIFVPTDGAFSLLPAGTLSKMTAAQTKRLVEDHVVSGRKLDPDAVRSGSIMALSKDILNFNVGPDMTSRVGSAIIIKAYEGSNGIVYLISGVLIPPKSK